MMILKSKEMINNAARTVVVISLDIMLLSSLLLFLHWFTTIMKHT